MNRYDPHRTEGMSDKELELRDAYDAGLNKHKHGANETNCHFRHFSTRPKMRAWEFGAEGKSFNLKAILKAAL